jgi:hypothetical protein
MEKIWIRRSLGYGEGVSLIHIGIIGISQF